IRMTTKEAVVSIMVVGTMPCKDDFQEFLKSHIFLSSQDVRATEKDKVKIYNSFRLGDIIRAE
ncbi:1058_t:CDS:2, partial [Racocetra fulgida]